MADDSAKQKSREVWDEMAPGWEKQRSLIYDNSLVVARWMVDALDPQPGQTILDFAAGPGDTGFLAARMLGDSGKLISTDFAPEMSKVAERSARGQGLSNVECRTLDAEHMDLEDDSVDGALCRWGLMLMQDPAAAAAETRRVLREGGRFVVSVWGAPEANPWVTIPVDVAVGQKLIPAVDATVPGGIFSLATEDKLRALLEDAGFESVKIESVPMTWRIDGFDGLWSFYTELAGVVAALVKMFPPETIEAFRQELRARAESYKAGDSYEIPALAVNAVAQ